MPLSEPGGGPEGIPHNPYINAGAIMAASLVKAELREDHRFDYVIETWTKLAGHPTPAVGFQNSTYMGERATASRNFCLGYMMTEQGAFPAGNDLIKTLESYFMYCSIECTVHTLSVVAGTFANGGTCPVTGRKVFEPDVVRNCLSVMHSCGMYDASGKFAYEMGFPCKSGVGGALKDVDIDEKQLDRLEGIVHSMTPAERDEVKVLDKSRNRRIAAGSGTQPHEVNRLVKQFDAVQKMTQQMAGMGMKGRMAAARQRPAIFTPGGRVPVFLCLAALSCYFMHLVQAQQAANEKTRLRGPIGPREEPRGATPRGKTFSETKDRRGAAD